MIRGKARLHDHDLGLQHDLGAFLAPPPSLGLSRVGDRDPGALSAFRQRPDIPNRSSRGDRQSLRRARVPSRPDRARGAVPRRRIRTMRMARWPMLYKSSGIVRRDMRTNIAKTAIAAEGQAFDLEITLVNVRQAMRAVVRVPRDLSLALLDALGRYSIYEIFPNASYLRAVGATDSLGNAAFTTIFPGCYPGRYPHIHFESLHEP